MKVLSVGPQATQAGGIASVVAELWRQSDADPSVSQFSVVDSGGLGDSWVHRLISFAKCLLTVLISRRAVVHLHVASRGSTWRKATVAAIAIIRRLPYGLHLHGGGYSDFLSRCGPISRRIVQEFFRHADYVVVLGHSWVPFVCADLKVPPDRIHIIPNGVSAPVEEPSNPLQQNTVLFLGRIERLKGVQDLLTAAQQLADIPVRFVLAGPPTDSVAVAAVLTAAAQQNTNVDYLGAVSRREARRLMSEASVFVLPSYAESFGMTLVEAMSVGVPCIACDVGAVDEVVSHGINGFLLDPGDVDSLTSHLRRLVSDPQLRARMGDAARETWEKKFQASMMFGQLVGVWRSVFDSR